ncbi:MAG: glycosyl transferase family 2 [Bacteroidetes bacterium GWE2_29_8]|nr:MAG: glycosyl transferase family 2 [Bacteroidetes bacterium GWE2_29_8]OFY17177.1 MAG: glycosyl transferase family 2 [Bacteroidetes bacterium GWF2_29_10]
MISVNNLSISFSGEYLFKQVSFVVNQKDRIGLVGRNGSGKSTLLKIFSGINKNFEGSISVPKDLLIGYLPQEINRKYNHTVLQEAMLAFEEHLSLQKDIDELNEKISNTTNHESDEYVNDILSLHEKCDRLDIIGGSKMESETEKVLKGLGFLSSEFDKDVSAMSGGWQMRIELAKILLKSTDVLLLDEPTNHLDIESIEWFEEYLKSYPGAVVLVSHDKKFLDNVCNRTIEIVKGKIYDYKTNYSHFVELRKERIEQQLATYTNQQKQIEQTEKFIERFRYKASKSAQVQSRIKMISKYDNVEIDDTDNSSMHFQFPKSPNSGKVVLEIEKVSKAYSDKKVLSNINLTILAGERIAFIGKNGLGKTTLVKIITNKIEYEGSVKTGYNVSTGYYAQNQTETLDSDITVFDTLYDLATDELRPRIRTLLGSFLFSGEDVNKKVGVLSGGEKSRLALAKLLLTSSNFLVLDEPTNHLDIKAKDMLKQALIKFDKTLIVVSHDRDFLDGLTNKVIEFTTEGTKEHLGTINEFLEKKKLEDLRLLNTFQSENKKTKETNLNDNKQQWQEKKSLEKELRKIQNKIKQIEQNIEKNEIKQREIELIIANNPNDSSLFEKYKLLQEDNKKLVEQWEETTLELEKQ